MAVLFIACEKFSIFWKDYKDECLKLLNKHDKSGSCTIRSKKWTPLEAIRFFAERCVTTPKDPHPRIIDFQVQVSSERNERNFHTN